MTLILAKVVLVLVGCFLAIGAGGCSERNENASLRLGVLISLSLLFIAAFL
jgi:hypothetical protein